MISIREARLRGNTQEKWLDSRHTFSFGQYQDPAHMGFHSIRVINDDRIKRGKGFSTHSHHDMEILSYVLHGMMEHKDSMGNGSIIRPGDVQIMSAGTGIEHSEWNPSKTEELHFLQIWIFPKFKNLKPRYQQITFDNDQLLNQLRLIASPDGRKGSLVINQTVDIYASRITPNHLMNFAIAPEHDVWLQVGSGELLLEGIRLRAGDGASISSEKQIEFIATENSEILLFDLV